MEDPFLQWCPKSICFSVSNQWLPQQWETVTVFLEENRQHIFYLLAFYLVTIALFIERFMREFGFLYRRAHWND